MPPRRKRTGLSYGISQSFSSLPGLPPSNKRSVINLSQAQAVAEQRAEMARISSSSRDAREYLFGLSSKDIFSDLPGNPLDTIPLGEEGYNHSHEPGTGWKESDGESMMNNQNNDGWEDVEDENDENDEVEMLAPRRRDQRTRRDRILKQVEGWNIALDSAVSAYLEWEAHGPPQAPENPDDLWDFTILSFDAFSTRKLWNPLGYLYLATSLARHGIIPSSPHDPMLGFDIRLLAIYRQLHRVCPRFSIDALAHGLHHIHKIPHRSYLAVQLRAAYDFYLNIMREVRKRMDQALNQEDKTIQQTIACPPCFYKLQGEPKLLPAFQASMDGNNSLKHIDPDVRSGKIRLDNRTLPSRRWVEIDEVDEFKDEVRNSQKENRRQQDTEESAMEVDQPPLSQDGDIAWLNVNEVKGLEECLNSCVDRWKAAAPEARKRMFSLFAVTGIFVIVCRHGHLLLICDMIKSRELMKYPLALLNRLLDEYGPDGQMGYDIWCAFTKTLSRSSIGSKADRNRLTGVVPAFHGHAHKRPCQLSWHPTFSDGSGIEDFEGCERTFNLSNNLASVTRLASAFHRRQEILEHFDFQDFDKHLNSRTFIFNNYSQALKRIQTEGFELKKICERLCISTNDLEKFHEQEKAYMKRLGEEDAEDTSAAEYIQLLLKGAALRLSADNADAAYKTMTTLKTTGKYTQKEIRSIETTWRTTYRKWQIHEERILHHEVEHGISERWLAGSAEFEAGKKRLSEGKFRKAVADLEHLIVRRMMEMTKLGMSGLGYKLRDKISKSLRTRGEAIRTALKKYNEAAAKLLVPAPSLTLDQALSMVTDGDFDYLRDLRNSKISHEWSSPAVRDAITYHFRIKRSYEEIDRLNVEIRRLVTFIRDEDLNYLHAIQNCVEPGLLHQLQQERLYRTAVHTQIAIQLKKTSLLPGFSGVLEPAKALNPSLSPPLNLAEVPTPLLTSVVSGTESDVRGVRAAGDDRNDPETQMLLLSEPECMDIVEDGYGIAATQEQLVTWLEGLALD